MRVTEIGVHGPNCEGDRRASNVNSHNGARRWDGVSLGEKRLCAPDIVVKVRSRGRRHCTRVSLCGASV